MQRTAHSGVRVGLAVGLLLAIVPIVAVVGPASAAGPTRVMPLGDSISAGVPNYPGGYRISLEDRMIAAGYSVDFVGSLRNGPATLADKEHQGHGGFTIDQIAEGVQGWMAAATPDVILLMIGTNDIGLASGQSTMATRLGNLLDQIAGLRPATHVIVASIPPQTGKTEAQLQAIRDYNAAIPGLAATRAQAGKKVSFADVHAVLTTADLADTVHPTPTGYGKVAGVWDTALRPVLPAPASPVPVYLSDLVPTSASNGFGPYERDLANGAGALGDGSTLAMKNTFYAKGLGVHAPSTLAFDLGGAYVTFSALAGIDDVVRPQGTITFQVYLDNSLALDTGRVSWDAGPIPITLNVSGKSSLRLVATDSGDGVSYDHGDWADAKLIPAGSTVTTAPTTAPPPTTVPPTTSPTPTTTTVPPTTAPPGGSTVFVSDLTPTQASNGFGPYERDRSNGGSAPNDGPQLRMKNFVYAKGLGVHAASSLTYNLAGGGYRTFSAQVGLDNAVGPDGTVVFQVFLDGVLVKDTGKVTYAASPLALSVDVTGKSTMRLVVTDAGDGIAYDHGDWADAKLTGSGGSPPTTTTTTVPPTTVPPTTTTPPTTTPPTTVSPSTTTVPPTTAPPGGSTVFVSDLTPTQASNGFGPYERDRSNGGSAPNDGPQLRMKNFVYAKGLGVHAASSLTYNLAGGGYRTFSAQVGLDNAVGPDGTVVFQVFLDGVLVKDTGKVTYAASPLALSVDVTGKSTMRLVVTDAGDGIAYDHGDWADAKLTGSGGSPPTTTTTTVPPTTVPPTTAPPGGSTVFVSDLTPTQASNGFGPYERDRSNGGSAPNDGPQLRMKNFVYAKGLGVHAASSLTYNLAGGGYRTFSAQVGLDNAVGPDGTVVFQVFLDGVLVKDTGKVTYAASPLALSVDVTGKSTMRLVVTDAGDGIAYDHGDWADAKLTK